LEARAQVIANTSRVQAYVGYKTTFLFFRVLIKITDWSQTDGNKMNSFIVSKARIQNIL
jgi:hypothetical protein